MSGLAVAVLTYSTRARGGVVHALAVAEALAGRGHHVELMAVGPPGARFFREPGVPARLVPYHGPDRPIEAKVLGMIDAYAGALERDAGRFDLLHAQDCLSASAALAAAERAPLPPLVRTVHHVDDFTSPALVECQRRSIALPDRVFVVSDHWRTRLRREFGVHADLVPNGVHAERFRPADERSRAAARARFGFGEAQVLLSVGGIEPRKGSLRLLEAYALCRRRFERLGLVAPVLALAGGETLFDYRDYRRRFLARLHELGLETDVLMLSPVPDDDMPALYQAADAFALPSVKEGFGLAVLEAQASGLPTVVSDLPVFREFLADRGSALVVRGRGAEPLAVALERVLLDRRLRARLRASGPALAARFTWSASAERHEALYRDLVRSREPGVQAPA
jgi:glycosyltransferase-like protein